MNVALHEMKNRRADRAWIRAIMSRYHHRRFVSPDPLEFLYPYEALRDREVVGLIASSLAYGNVTAMRRAIESILHVLGPSPAVMIRNASYRSLVTRFRGFRYRFTTGRQLAGLLHAAAAMQTKHDTMGRALALRIDPDDETVLRALEPWVDDLHARAHIDLGHLLPNPRDGSACKRLNLFLRWMVRRDEIDPGGWSGLHPRQLVIPLDTHIARIARQRGWLTRRTPDLVAALQVTAALRQIDPDDPVRFDFALTRPGIRREHHERRPSALASA